jgi:N-acetylglucosamine-6-phosphate deacetylase
MVMSSLLLTGAEVLMDGEFRRADLVVVDGVITAVGSPAEPGPAERIDCAGLLVAPGFIDLQCNGAFGIDFTTEPSGIERVAADLSRFGVTTFLPTVVSSTMERRRAALDVMADLRGRRASASGASVAADPLALHFEGPMLSRHHMGAHVPAHVMALTMDELEDWSDAGVVGLVTLAPELPGAIAVIERLRRDGVVVSAGHTAMTPADLAAARSVGLSYTTHLFNAMAPFSHRSPGPIGSVLADDTLVAGIIVDGIHVDPTAVHLAWNALGPDRMSLVSDSSPALGLPFGRTHIAGFEIVYDETGVRTVDGALAGSALELDQAVRNLVSYTGCSLADALATVTSTPADLLGLTDRGRLREGLRADLVILEPDGRLVATIIAGAVGHGSL